MLNQHQPKRHFNILLAGILTLASLPGAFAAGTMSTTQSSQVDSMMHTPPTGTTNGSLYQQETTVSTTTHRSVVVPAGTSLSVQPVGQMPQSLGGSFTGQLVNPVMVNGVSVIPAGSQVRGNVVGVNDSMNTMDIQFREISTTTGDTIPIRSRSTVNRIYGGVQQAGPQGVQMGQVGQTTRMDAGTTLYPHVTIGRPATTRAGRIVAGTVGGAALGAATGTLTGLVWPAVYRNDIGFSEGTGALRGLAWGAIFGGGLGLVSGLVAAAADRDDVSVTTTQQPRQMRPLTNISTGSLEEIPVAYSTTGVNTGMQGQQQFNIILEEPVTVTL